MDPVTLGAAKAYAQQGRPYMTLPKGWDATWKAAKAARASTQARVLLVADSVGSGQGSTDWLSNGWLGRLITAQGGTTGQFYPAYTYGAVSVSNQAGTMPFSLVSSGTAVEGGYGRCVICPSGQSPSTTFTTPFASTAIDIVYIDYASGTWTYAVDGGGAVTVTTTGPGTTTGAQVKKVSITGLARTTHTVAIGSGSGGNVLILAGVSVYTTTSSGIAWARNTYPGIRAVDLATASGSGFGQSGLTSFPPDKIVLWQGQSPGGNSPSTPTGFGFPTQPHLAIISLGINDCDLGAPIQNYATTLRRYVSAFRRGVQNASVLILAASRPDGASSDVQAGGRGYAYGNYKRVMAQTADAYGAAFVDIDSKWQELGSTLGFQGAADLHPTDAGHTDIATVLGAIL